MPHSCVKLYCESSFTISQVSVLQFSVCPCIQRVPVHTRWETFDLRLPVSRLIFGSRWLRDRRGMSYHAMPNEYLVIPRIVLGEFCCRMRKWESSRSKVGIRSITCICHFHTSWHDGSVTMWRRNRPVVIFLLFVGFGHWVTMVSGQLSYSNITSFAPLK